MLRAAAPAHVERPDVADRVPARDQRAVVPAAALPARRARKRLDGLLHPRLQPGVDESRRLLLDRDAARRPDRVGCYVALTPTWNETAFFADYILPMGHASERHDLHSYEQYDGQWIGFRQPVLRAARERLGERRGGHARREPRRGLGGERVLDRAVVADRSRRVARHPQVLRVAGGARARSSASTSTTRTSSSTPCRGCRSGPRPRASRRSRSCAGTARSRSRARSARCHEIRVPLAELEDVRVGRFGRAYTRAPQPADPNIVPRRQPASPTPRDAVRSGCRSTGRSSAGSRRRRGAWSSTPARSWSGGGRSARCRRTSAATCIADGARRPIRWC